MKRIIILLFFGLFMFQMDSCVKDIAITLPSAPAMLVVNSLLESDSIVRVYVSKSAPALGNSKPESVPDAGVQLYRNGQLLESMIYQSDIGAFKSTNKIEAGQTYKLYVTKNGFNNAEAEDNVPVKPVLGSVSKALADSLDQITVTFTDDASATNFYKLDLYTYSTFGVNYSLSPVFFNSSDPVFTTEPTSYAVFDDKLINGKQHSFKLEVPNQFSDGGQVKYIVKLHSISKSYFNYITSLQNYENSEGDPFSEPVHITTNVKNGLGIMGTLSTVADTVN